MGDPLEDLARSGPMVLFLAVFAEQIGVPIPSAPVILAAGALAGGGRMNPAAALAAILAGSLLADSLWYALGRRYGARVLEFLCRVALEPDSCVRDTRDRFARHGAWLIVTAKFVPGVNTVTPPLAGMSGLGVSRFLALDAVGVVAQSTLLLGAGSVLRGPLGRFARWLSESAGRAPLFLIAALLAYAGWKYARRRRVLRDLETARITPADLKTMLDAGRPVVIVDLRHRLEQETLTPTLPGAIRMQPDELAARHEEIPRDREIVLFCT